jgi:hypothetical protein
LFLSFFLRILFVAKLVFCSFPISSSPTRFILSESYT